jgi:hypothetical protein
MSVRLSVTARLSPRGAVPVVPSHRDNHRGASDRIGGDGHFHPEDLPTLPPVSDPPVPARRRRGVATPPADQGRRPRHDREVGGDRGRSAGRLGTARGHRVGDEAVDRLVGRHQARPAPPREPGRTPRCRSSWPTTSNGPGDGELAARLHLLANPRRFRRSPPMQPWVPTEEPSLRLNSRRTVCSDPHHQPAWEPEAGSALPGIMWACARSLAMGWELTAAKNPADRRWSAGGGRAWLCVVGSVRYYR